MSLPFRLKGPLFMVVAAASYVVNDTLMKLATVGLPPYEVLILRGISATLWGLPLLLVLGLRRHIPKMLEPAVLMRNGFELLAILSFIVALANMPIANATALGQLTPLLVLVGASFVFGERLGFGRGVLVGLGFAGALLVAQPTPEGVSLYALLALATAVCGAARDVASRKVSADVPGLVVAFGATTIVLVGAALFHVAFESWTMPTPRHLALLGAAGLFLFGGHFFIFMAYRVGPAGTVAPFYYFFSVWAVVSGLSVFGHLPNPVALTGIALIVASGVAVVLMDRRQKRLAPVS
jgi:drug/metabolite transporter (DMT)-like permease